MRLLGKGLRAMELFCGIMDLPQAIAQTSFDAIMSNIEVAVRAVAGVSMKTAAKEEMEEMTKNDKNPPHGLIVSGDGSWMKRGFTSLFGVATIIGHFTGKVLDTMVKSAYCKECESHEKMRETVEYETWFQDHVDTCSANHSGSSGKMEVDAMVEMFKRSVELHNVKYAFYVGDGDSKTFTAINNSKPYDDFDVVKKECIGHVQKRMGTRLRNAKKTASKSADKRDSLSGKGKLTAKLIDELSVYYGLAIRNNCDSVENMKKAIYATFYHKISTNDKPQHSYCPTGSNSWCTWQQANAEGRLATYEHKPALSESVEKVIKPIYDALSNEDLLSRCVGGYTQNANESLNAKIWKICPKVTPGSRSIVQIATDIASATYNDGAEIYMQILQVMGCKVGQQLYNYCDKEDANRLRHARIKAAQATKEARTARRCNKNILNEQIKAQEGPQYGAGIAN